jgi:hypothetical protein
VVEIGRTPAPVNTDTTLGVATALAIYFCIRSMIAGGVPAGAIMPNQYIIL